MSSASGVSGSGSDAWAALNFQRSNHQAKMFAKVDADGSGSVDLVEQTTPIDKVRQNTGACFDDATKVFTAMDANEDGTVSLTERLAGSFRSDPVQALFKAMDTDRSGKISSDESDVFANKLSQMLYEQVASSLATSSGRTSLSAVD
jgi:Ca2+-binding EF-hand superfamily protein